MIPPFYRLHVLDETVSTNTDAKRAAEAGEAEGLVIQARRQTAGRGRYGRSWESPEGNLYVSVLLRPCCSLQAAGHYTFVAAMAVYETVQSVLPGTNIKLKWPNDVLVEKKKISGILLEAAPVDNNVVPWLVIGVGMNVQHYPEQSLYPATSLAAEGAQGVMPDAMLGKLLQSLDFWRSVFMRDGFAPVRAAWLRQAQTGPLKVTLPDETVEGTFAGFDAAGRLIVRLPDGVERFLSAGDVFFAT